MFEHGFPPEWSTLKKLIWLRGAGAIGEVLKTITGSIVSFIAKKVTPIEELKVAIEPVQDLHGQDAPYPAGGSKNLIPDGTDTSKGYVNNYAILVDGTMASNTAVYISEYFPVTEGATYTWSTKSPSSINLGSVCFYDSNKNFISGIAGEKSFPKTITAPVGAVYCRTHQNHDFETCGTQLELGSVATTIKPYSNICPITGWTGANITRIGSNLYSGTPAPSPNNVQYFGFNGGWAATTLVDSTPIPPNTTVYYTVEFNESPGKNFYIYGAWRDIKKQITVSAASSSLKRQFTITNSSNYERYFGIWAYVVSGSSFTGKTATCQISLNGYSDYEPYNKTEIPISWQTEAGTVYYGSATYNGNGTWTIQPVYVKASVTRNFFANATDIWYDSGRNAVAIRNAFYNTGNGVVYRNRSRKVYGYYCISNIFKVLALNNTNYISSQYALYFVAPDGFDGSSPKTSLLNLVDSIYADGNTIDFLYQPTDTIPSYTVTTEQLYTLKGENNIWADAAAVTVTAAGIQEITPSSAQALNMLLGGMYTNNHTADDVSDDEALNIILGGSNA